MTRLFVKICGITNVEDGLAACEAGADAVGFVFWPTSPRAVDATTARRIGQALPASIARVGVFVDADRPTLERTAEEAGLDLLQLHGSESPRDMEGLPRRVWKALRVDAALALATAVPFARAAAGVLLDTKAERPGGTGTTFDWSIAASLRSVVPFMILAGGLTPENVADAVTIVRPDGVDVSSGVELAPGRKDRNKIRAFVARARQA